MGVSGGTMVLVTALVRLIAGDRLPRRGYVALWTAAILRLLLPLQIASPVSFYGFLAGTAVPVERLGAIAVGETPAGLPIWTVLWLAGAAVTGIAFAVSYLRCIRAFRTGTPLESQFVDEWLAKNAHGRRVVVRVLPGLRTPLTYGLLHPVILLPEEAERWDEERLGMVLCHELTHIRRWDGALKKLSVVALCLHWCNPAAWLMVALLDRDIEIACDGAVVEQFGPNSRGQYARLLIDLRAPQRGSPLVTGFGQNVTERRVLGVMRHRRAGKVAVAVSAVLVVSVIGYLPLRQGWNCGKKCPAGPLRPRPMRQTDCLWRNRCRRRSPPAPIGAVSHSAMEQKPSPSWSPARRGNLYR